MQIYSQTKIINIQKNYGLAVVGNTLNNLKEVKNIIENCKKKYYICFTGNLFNPNNREIYDYIFGLKLFNIFSVIGPKELECKNLYENIFLGIKFIFHNNNQIVVVRGGVLPEHKLFADIHDDIRVCYVRELDHNQKMIPQKEKKAGTQWHHYYDGRFGYIISANGKSGPFSKGLEDSLNIKVQLVDFNGNLYQEEAY